MPDNAALHEKTKPICREISASWYYCVLEEMTRWKMQQGKLADEIPETLVAKGGGVSQRLTRSATRAARKVSCGPISCL